MSLSQQSPFDLAWPVPGEVLTDRPRHYRRHVHPNVCILNLCGFRRRWFYGVVVVTVVIVVIGFAFAVVFISAVLVVNIDMGLLLML